MLGFSWSTKSWPVVHIGVHTYTHIYTRDTCTQSSDRRRFDEEKGVAIALRCGSSSRNFSMTLCVDICLKTTTGTKSLHARSKFLGCDALGLPFPVALDVFNEDSLSIRRRHFTWFFLHLTTFIIYLYKHHSYCGVDFKTDKNIYYTLTNCWSLHTLVLFVILFRATSFVSGNVNCRMN